MMRVQSYVRRAVTAWLLWKAQIRLRRAVPALAALSAKRAKIARQRKAGCREIDMQMREAVTARLMRELGRA